MGLRDRLRRIERDIPTGGTLHLPDGAEITYGPEEMLDALCAAMEGGEHRLIPYLRQIETNRDMPGLIRALEGDADGA